MPRLYTTIEVVGATLASRGRPVDVMQRTFNRALHYLRPLVPPVGWEVLQTMQSYSRGGPLVALPPHRRVLVLSPHPDDEVIGCGGTAALLARREVALRTVIATSGQHLAVPDLGPAEVAAARRNDARPRRFSTGNAFSGLSRLRRREPGGIPACAQRGHQRPCGGLPA